MTQQLTIDGQADYLTPEGVMKATRRIMTTKLITYRSHRLLMFEIAREWGFKWDQIPTDQRHILERLFDLSPDIERCARKIREEDAREAAGKRKESIEEPIAPEVQYDDDPFDAIERDRAKRKRWQR